MGNKEQDQRERAYKIWENEGRPEGAHEDHWRRGEEMKLSKQQADDVTTANQEADDEFAGGDESSQNAADIRPPSTVVPD